jgi:hypothetical protein
VRLPQQPRSSGYNDQWAPAVSSFDIDFATAAELIVAVTIASMQR